MTRVGIVTQARTNSTRLPGKVLIPVGGRTLLDHHLDRLATSGLPVLVATTGEPADDAIADLARRRGMGHHRGSEQDVLARFHGCAEEHGLDVVVRVTSDCPLIDGRVVAEAVDAYLREDDPALYLSNVVHRTFPRGFDFEVFGAALLADAHRHAVAPAEREHVTPYLRAAAPDRVRTSDWTWPVDRSGYRVTLDTVEDLRLIERLIEDHGAAELDCAGVIDVLDRHPELVAINRDVVQK